MKKRLTSPNTNAQTTAPDAKSLLRPIASSCSGWSLVRAISIEVFWISVTTMKNQQNINNSNSWADKGPNRKYTNGIPIMPKTIVSKRTAKSRVKAYFNPRSGWDNRLIQYLMMKV